MRNENIAGVPLPTQARLIGNQFCRRSRIEKHDLIGPREGEWGGGQEKMQNMLTKRTGCDGEGGGEGNGEGDCNHAGAGEDAGGCLGALLGHLEEKV